MQAIEAIGPEFEAFGTRLVDYIAPVTMQHRGINEKGHPVGHVVDSVSETGHLAAEYGAEQGYFEPPFKKIFNDLRHARKAHPQVAKILLLSSQKCGPKAHTRLINLRSRIKRFTGIDVEIYDSRRQAEFIVDQLLLNDRAVGDLSTYLPHLERVRSETAATKLVPRQASGYLHRTDLERSVIEMIQREKAAILSGLSGSGKSETAVAVTEKLAVQFELVIWVSCEGIKAIDDLQAVDVERRGHRLNVLHLLRDRSCLLILDDFRLGLSVSELKQLCGKASAVLVTRQSAYEGDLRMPLLERPEARALLERDVSTPCPDEVFEVVWKTVGGHPLALRLLNAGVRGGSWEELTADCAAIGQYEDEDRLQRLADRLLGRLARLLERELSFVAWCNTPRIDRSFARRALGPVGVRKMGNACLLAPDRSDIIRVHDIVYAAIATLHIPVDRYAPEFNAALDAHIEQLAFGEDTSLSFLNFRQLHGPKIESLLRANPGRSSCLYCLANGWSDERVDPQLVGNLIARANEIREAKEPKDIDVSAVCEAVEAIYRKTKSDLGIDAARRMLEGHFGVFSTLADAPQVSPVARRTALHHHAKALRNLKRFGEAIKFCETILARYESPATKLLLARLLLFASDPTAPARAKQLLFELLEQAQASPESAEISVTLAAIETLGRWQLKEWRRESLKKFGDLVADYIVASAERGFDLASVAFAAIGRELRYNDPELFVKVFERLPPRTPEEAADDQELAAWGDILLSASEIAEIGRPEQLASEALQFYGAISDPKPYHVQQRGHALVLLGRNEDAATALNPVVASNPNPWNRYWLSKAMFALGDRAEAMRLIDDAIADPKSESFRAAMLQHRWEIRKAQGDPAAVEDLKRAHYCSTNDRHKAALAATLKTELGGNRTTGGAT